MTATCRLNNVLLITDDAHLAAFINEQLTGARYTVTLCTGGSRMPQSIMRLFLKHCFDAVLLDMNILVTIGPEIIRMIRLRDEKLGIILLSCPGAAALMRFAGRDDILMVNGPADPGRLLMTLDRMMTRKRFPETGNRHTRIPAPLVENVTGLYARSYFCERLAQEIHSMQRNGGGFSVLLCAVRGLKRIYHDYGTIAGDAVLRQVSSAVRETCRRCDTVARTRVDEISIILPTASIEGSRIVADRLVNAVSTVSHESMGDGSAAIAIGMSTYPVHADLSSDLLHKADRALCQSRAKLPGMYTMYPALVSGRAGNDIGQ
jgi:diguanylate cyclase (GGDEF)-like protein